MTTADLQKKIAEVLGVSSSEKELAFEIFILKVSDILEDNVTLKVPRIGFFQVRQSSQPNSSSQNLVFVPITEDMYKESKNLFLTIQIPSHHQVTQELDSNVFSIGVGKPILPLTGDESSDTETSYAILRKSIEERVNELLAESDQMPHFNIWDDYYSITGKENAEPDSAETLNDLTSDLEIRDELIADDLTRNLLELSSDVPDAGSNDDILSSADSGNDLLKNDDISLYELLGDYKQTPESEELKTGSGTKESNNSNEEDDSISLNDLLWDNNQRNMQEENTSEDLDENKMFGADEHLENENNEKVSGDDEFSRDLIAEELKKEFADIDNDENPVENNFEIHGDQIPEETGNSLDVTAGELSKNSDDSASEGKSEFDNEVDEIFESLKNSYDESAAGEDTDEPNLIDKIEEARKDTEDKSPVNLVDELIEDLRSDPEVTDETGIVENESVEIEVPKSGKEIVYEIKRESKLDDVPNEDDEIEPVHYLGLKRKEDEPIEWDWGDELKEEFGIEFLKEADLNKLEEKEKSEEKEKNEEKDDDKDSLETMFRKTRAAKSEMFDKLETTIREEVDKVENEEHAQVLEYSGSPAQYQFVEEQPKRFTDKEHLDFAGDTFQSRTAELRKEIEDENGFSFGKSFLIILSSFIIITAVIVYLLLSGKQEPEELNATVNVKADSLVAEKPAANKPADSSTEFQDSFNDFPRVAKLPVKDGTNNAAAEQQTPPVGTNQNPSGTSNNDLYRTLTTDTRINKTIYFDGKEYNFQVSSWRNKIKAEDEVKRLRGKGINAFATEVFLPEKGGTWYRVRIGGFKTQQEAEQYSSQNNF